MCKHLTWLLPGWLAGWLTASTECPAHRSHVCLFLSLFLTVCVCGCVCVWGSVYVLCTCWVSNRRFGIDTARLLLSWPTFCLHAKLHCPLNWSLLMKIATFFQQFSKHPVCPDCCQFPDQRQLLSRYFFYKVQTNKLEKVFYKIIRWQIILRDLLYSLRSLYFNNFQEFPQLQSKQLCES